MGLSPQNNLINGLKGRLFSKNGQKKNFLKKSGYRVTFFWLWY